MTLLATIYQTSLSDPPATSAIAALSDWVSGLVFGPLATLLAVIAVAWLGFGMLTGRLDIRRGLAVLLGCFLVFGAQSIAEALRAPTVDAYQARSSDVPASPTYQATPKQNNNPAGYDPYAGASVSN
jgi:type IV secretion system protein VirB2